MALTDETVFINVSNHSSLFWGKEQLSAAQEIGKVIDYPFPSVPAEADTSVIRELADQVCSDLEKYPAKAVMVQGEFTLTYQIVSKLKASGCRVVAACTVRDVKEKHLEDGTTAKESRFRFVQFRDY